MLRHVSWADNLGWLNKSFCGRIEFKDWKAHMLALASSHCSSEARDIQNDLVLPDLAYYDTQNIPRTVRQHLRAYSIFFAL